MNNYTLENIEWTQYWAEECTSDKHRVLMIGDSISVGYRSEVNRQLPDTLSIAAHSTSKAVDNPWFTEEIAMNIRQHAFAYDIVTFNNGLHGFHLNAAEYEAGMRTAVDALRKLLPEAKLYLVLSTPITENGKPDTLSEKNGIVTERNAVVTRIADALGLPVIDLYGTVLGKPELRSADGYHYNGKGYRILAEEIVRNIV